MGNKLRTNFKVSGVKKGNQNANSFIYKKKNAFAKKKYKSFYKKQDEDFDSDGEEEEIDTKVPLKMLHIPKVLIEQSEKEIDMDHTDYDSMFKNFNKIASVTKFEKDSEIMYPRDTFKGLSSRLKYNGKTRTNYLNFYSNKHKRAVSNAVGKI